MSRPTVTERPVVAPAAWGSAVCAWPDDEARDWSRRLIDAALKDPAVEAVVATGSAVRDVDHSDDLRCKPRHNRRRAADVTVQAATPQGHDSQVVGDALQGADVTVQAATP